MKLSRSKIGELKINSESIEKIEDELDLKAYYQAVEESKGQSSISLEEMEQKLGI